MSEVRSPTFKSVGFVVTGSDVRWHVRGVRLVESTGEGRVLYNIPLGMPSTDVSEAESGQLINTDPDVGTWQHFLVLLETNGVVVELTTDVAGVERVLRPIRAENATDWFSPPCPYTD